MIYYCSHTEPCYGSGNLSVSWSLLFMWRGVEHSPPPAMPVWTKSEQTGVGPCYEISQSSDSIICLKNINVKWQFYRLIFSSYPFYNCGSQQCQIPSSQVVQCQGGIIPVVHRSCEVSCVFHDLLLLFFKIQPFPLSRGLFQVHRQRAMPAFFS